jgi:hypothetical protein
MKKGTAIFLLIGLSILIWGIVQQAKWTFSVDTEPAHEAITIDQ